MSENARNGKATSQQEEEEEDRKPAAIAAREEQTAEPAAEPSLVRGAPVDGVATARTSTTYTSRELGLNEQDDPQQAVDWLQNGKIDAKNCEKIMPHTIQDLVEGKTSEEALTESLGRVLTDTIKITANDDSSVEGTLMEVLSTRLSSKSIDEWWCRNEEQKQWLFETAHPGFAADLLARCQSIGHKTVLGELFFWDLHIARPVMSALQQTCEEWAPRVDNALFKGQSGTFLFICPTNNLSNSDAAELVRSILQKPDDDRAFWKAQSNVRTKYCLLKQALSLVSVGITGALKSCWQCEVVSDQLMRCSKCGAALYCSHACQLAAWKGGHKRKCLVLKEKHDLFKESLQAVDQAHAGRGMIIDIRLCSVLDYNLTLKVFEEEVHPFVLQSPNGSLFKPRGPSMKLFYENLGRIVRGDWWLYEDADALDDYFAKTGFRRSAMSNSEEDYFQGISRCLTYDFSGPCASTGGTGSPEAASWFNALLQSELSTPGSMRYQFGASMPAKRFIELYSMSQRKYVGVRGFENRVKSNITAEIMAFFRDTYHK